MGFNEIVVFCVQFGIAWGLQKLGLILENKVTEELKLSKNVFYKKCGTKLIFFNEIFFRKIQTLFDIEN